MRFWPSLRSNPLGDLINLKQSGPVDGNFENFQMFLDCVPSILPEHQVSIFTVSVHGRLCFDVESQAPQDLSTAMSFACICEKCLLMDTSSGGHYDGYGTEKGIRESASACCELDFVPFKLRSAPLSVFLFATVSQLALKSPATPSYSCGKFGLAACDISSCSLQLARDNREVADHSQSPPFPFLAEHEFVE
ncbi:hypothetical protein KSP39_PZI010441 [Platanthera zijinensis]|uniref:Uncharacterized protein n=1 Tax=Platanthera zijinensis TaxID=2320716 RepID=A0AAP0G7B4_9ASPA